MGLAAGQVLAPTEPPFNRDILDFRGSDFSKPCNCGLSDSPDGQNAVCKIARKQVAPDLLVVPVAAPTGAMQ